MAGVKKRERKEAGAPAWMVTYGDMVTLLLTFFVMLLAMSEVKKEDQFLEFMQAIRQAFGYQGGVQAVPLEAVQMPRNIDYTEMLVLPIHAHDFSKAHDPGIRGDEPDVRANRPRDVFVVGGRIEFPSLSNELSEAEDARIIQFAEELRGYGTMIKVSGHCSKRPLDDTSFIDHVDLSYRRARMVAEALIRHGIAPERIVIEAAGTNKPVASHTYTEVERLRNDVVEILQVDARVDEFAP